MGVHERLEPRASIVILDLHNVREGERAVLLGDELQRGWVLVKLARKLGLSRTDCVLDRDGRRGRRDGY